MRVLTEYDQSGVEVMLLLANAGNEYVLLTKLLVCTSSITR